MLAEVFMKMQTYQPAKKALWRGWYELLALSSPTPFYTFMNYGYQPDLHEEPSVPLLDDDEKNRLNIELYELLLRQNISDGMKILEIGCGRGGGSEYIARTKSPQIMCGVDISRRAISLCNKFHQRPHLEFRRADAERIPYPNDTFDRIINIESSHCYRSLDSFAVQVSRLLVKGGRFLWADLGTPEFIATLSSQCENAGLSLLHCQEITAGVLRSLDQSHDHKEGLIQKSAPFFIRADVRKFAGLKGSPIYARLEDGKDKYVLMVFEKA